MVAIFLVNNKISSGGTFPKGPQVILTSRLSFFLLHHLGNLDIEIFSTLEGSQHLVSISTIDDTLLPFGYFYPWLCN